ncbi:MAG: CBS domain-containing protein [Candidatus Kaiserbacteria bacterium]|nr:CBS domain-containing protein [Candidatus Kaiserbacteria bacterium]MCB9816215.1 CBS domain-containing protein [Candidatus Nomurabacteria bacterium]
MQVKDIVKPAVIIAETDTFEDALKAMNTQHTNTLLVTDENGELVGEVTVADLLDAVVPDTLDGSAVMDHFSTDDAFIASIDVARDLPVSEFMSLDYSPLTLKDNLMSIVATAIAHERARIPVVDDENHPIGIISRQGLKQILAKFMDE